MEHMRWMIGMLKAGWGKLTGDIVLYREGRAEMVGRRHWHSDSVGAKVEHILAHPFEDDSVVERDDDEQRAAPTG